MPHLNTVFDSVQVVTRQLTRVYCFHPSRRLSFFLPIYQHLERHGLIPKNPMYTLKNCRVALEIETILSREWLGARIPYTAETIAALQKSHREKKYEKQASARQAVTVSFLLQSTNKLKKSISWSMCVHWPRPKSEIRAEFLLKLPQLPRLPSNIVQVIASYFNFEDLTLQKLQALEKFLSKPSIATPSPPESYVF